MRDSCRRYAVLVMAALLTCSLLCVSCSSSRSVSKAKPSTTAERSEDLSGPRRTLAVLEFENKTHFGKSRLGDAATDILITGLSSTGRFILVERARIQEAIDELKIQASGLVDPATAAELGRFVGASAVLIGAVTNYGERVESKDVVLFQSKTQTAECSVDARIIDTGSGEIIYAVSGSGEAERDTKGVLGTGGHGSYDEVLAGEALRAAINKFAEELAGRVDETEWKCYVAEVAESGIYLTAGKRSNLSVGTTLSCWRLGDEIRDPATGRVLGRARTKTSTVIRVESYFGEDGSVATLVEGSAPARGDICLLREG